MPDSFCFHSARGAGDFLGVRKGPGGATEIVYDDGGRRMIWRVRSPAADGVLGAALRQAVDQRQVVPALYAELKRLSISIEAVAG